MTFKGWMEWNFEKREVNEDAEDNGDLLVAPGGYGYTPAGYYANDNDHLVDNKPYEEGEWREYTFVEEGSGGWLSIALSEEPAPNPNILWQQQIDEIEYRHGQKFMEEPLPDKFTLKMNYTGEDFLVYNEENELVHSMDIDLSDYDELYMVFYQGSGESGSGSVRLIETKDDTLEPGIGLGRQIKAGQPIHSADYNSLRFASAGLGHVIPVGETCKPELTGDGLEVKVHEGRVFTAGMETGGFNGGVLRLESNGGNEARYDLIYLKYDQEKVEAKVEKGIPDEKPIHSDIPRPPGEKVVPIAVVHFEEGADEISELKDCRTIVDLEHIHRAGAAMELDHENRKMDLQVDDETIKIENDELTVGEIDWETLDLNIGEGLLEEEVDGTTILHVDEDDSRLGFDEEEKIELLPDQLDGEGLEEEDGKLKVIAGDGLKTDDGKVAARTGEGTKISEWNEEIRPDLKSYGGLTSLSEGLSVKADHFAGEGLDSEAGLTHELTVNVSHGLQGPWEDGKLNISRGKGIKLEDGKIRADIGGGIEIEDVGEGRMYVETELMAGTGIYENDGKLHVGTGDGTSIVSERLDVETGDGIYTNDPDGEDPGEYVLEPHLDPDGSLGFGGGSLRVYRGELAGEGLGVNGDKLQVDPGSALKLQNNKLGINVQGTRSGLRVGEEEFYVRIDDLAGSSVNDEWIKDYWEDGNAKIDIEIEDVFELVEEKNCWLMHEGHQHTIHCGDPGDDRYPVMIGVCCTTKAEDVLHAVEFSVQLKEGGSAQIDSSFIVQLEHLGCVGGDDYENDVEVYVRVYHVRLDGAV